MQRIIIIIIVCDARVRARAYVIYTCRLCSADSGLHVATVMFNRRSSVADGQASNRIERLGLLFRVLQSNGNGLHFFTVQR